MTGLVFLATAALVGLGGAAVGYAFGQTFGVFGLVPTVIVAFLFGRGAASLLDRGVVR